MPHPVPPLLVRLAVTGLLLAGCGGSSDPVGTGSAGDAAGPTAVAATEPGLPGCSRVDGAAPEVADALAEALRTDAEVGPAVLTDDGEGGRVLTATLVVDDGEEYVSASWAVVDGGDGPTLLPLTEEALAVSPEGTDTSRMLEPGPDGAIVLGDTPGSGGIALGSDCSLALAQEAFPPPPAPAPDVRPDLIVASPATVAPGDVVELTFPEGTDRGIAFQLDRVVPGGWETSWWMTSDANGGSPTTVPVGSDGFAVEDVGVGGPGPDRVLVHADTEPGEYRVCTANAREDFCTTLTVAAP